jgi:hypothetical protein
MSTIDPAAFVRDCPSSGGAGSTWDEVCKKLDTIVRPTRDAAAADAEVAHWNEVLGEHFRDEEALRAHGMVRALREGRACPREGDAPS